MRNFRIRKLQIALSALIFLAYTQSSYAQIYSDKERIAQNARQSGYTAREQGNYLEAVKHFEFGCSSGSADSCVQLGMLYGGSRLTSNPDLAKAIIYLERALTINPKETTALKFVAAWRGDSAFDRQDYTEAARHLRVACIRKSENSCSRLGWLYQNGYGVAQSNLQAIALYRRELAFRPRHPSAYPGFIKAQDDFNKSPAGYNAYPAVSKKIENMLRQLIIGDSKYWLSSSFDPTSLKNVRIISGHEGSSTWSIRADFLYGSYPNQLGGAREGWVVAEFWGNSLYCFQFNDTEGCRDMYTPENQQGFQFGPAFFRNSTAPEVAQGCRLDGNRCQGDK